MRDLKDQLTVFVTTVGDETNFTNAMECLDRQTVKFQLEVIRGVAPLCAAFNQMHVRCKTPYYVQVDEDMMLFPHGVEALFDRIVKAPADMAIVVAPLWDCEVERPILGVKIYRYEIVSLFPYENSFSCELTQVDQLEEAGYRTDQLPMAPWNCLGEHGKFYTPETIFARWQRLVRKQRQSTRLNWVSPWPRRLLERYQETGSELHLWALLGAVSGIVGELPPEAEQDFRAKKVEFERLKQYFDADCEPESVQPPFSTRVLRRLLSMLSRIRGLWR